MNPLQQKFHRLIRAARAFDDRFYARNNPDILATGVDLLEHYIVSGESEGRAPSMFFDPAWYRSQARKVRPEHCMLAHYLTVGDGEGYQPMVGLDPPFVRSQLGRRMEPAMVGYMRALSQGRPVNPNRFFDYAWYEANNPDVVAAGVDAFYHFVHAGADENRMPSEDFSWFLLRERYHLAGSNSEVFRALMQRWRLLNLDTVAEDSPGVLLLQDEVRANHKPSDLYEAHAPASPAGSRRTCDVFAFYLTQYHRVRENDAWWGEGFTEWHNVVRGMPRFSGHYQPRTPSALGFYDLEDPRVLPRQVELARQAGLAGFAFYYYHFGEQRLLERPLERFLENPALDAQFFLIWANETWSRRWDGSENELLLEQRYPDTLIGEIADDLIRHAADPRYRRIDGRPLFVIYRVGSLPDPTGWLAAFREACRDRGEDPLLYLAQTFEDLDPRRYDLDGAMEFPPHKHSRNLPLAMPTRLFGANPAMKVWDYDRFVDAALSDRPVAYPLIRSCFPSWDNDSRRQGASSIIHGSTPERFRRWLETLVASAEAGPEPIVCINAWNEWGEGAYLEPDRHFGYAYLNTVQAVMHPLAAGQALRIVLVGHDAFAAGAQRLLLNLGRTLATEFRAEVRFVLLRADAGYDALVDDYRAVAQTIVCDAAATPFDMVAARLVREGFGHAIVNSSASAAALSRLAAAGIVAINLVHELPGVFADLGAGPLVGAATETRAFVASTRTIAAMLEGAGVASARIALLPQGQYRRVARIDRGDARALLLGVEDRRTVIASLGFGDRRKGIDLFIEACEAALMADAPLLFVWQGDWDAEQAALVGNRAEVLIAAGYLHHIPDSPEIETLLNAADVFFLPSREDPLPSAAIEAWSCGLPVVAMAGGGGITDMIAETPMLGAIALGEGTLALLAGIEAGVALGRSEARAQWAHARFDWPGYVRALLRIVIAPPVVDVAIIGHNHGRFAEPRVASVVAQTLPARAIAYHDVASTDGSGAAAEQVARRLGVSFVEEPANSGRLYETWAALVAASDAEFFHIAEGDDWIAPTMIERCVQRLREAPDAAYAFVGVEWIDAADQVVADHVGYPTSVIGEAAQDGAMSAETLIGSEMHVRNPVLSMSSVVWRREVLARLLADHAHELAVLGFAFDWLLYLRAAAAGHGAVFVAEALCRHRQHDASYAERSDNARHRDEIARVYALNHAPALDARRAEYLASIG